jgi:hypothetical protein
MNVAASFVERADEQPSKLKSIFASSVIGTAVEWYDFTTYGLASALVFNKLFFPMSWRGTARFRETARIPWECDFIKFRSDQEYLSCPLKHDVCAERDWSKDRQTSSRAAAETHPADADRVNPFRTTTR